jgi:hypothetical protein
MRQKHKRTNVSLERTREKRRTGERGIKKGALNRRIIKSIVVGSREYTEHSTKGFRSSRV